MEKVEKFKMMNKKEEEDEKWYLQKKTRYLICFCFTYNSLENRYK